MISCTHYPSCQGQWLYMHIQSTKLLDFIHTPSLRRMNYKFHMNSSRTCGSLGETDGSWCRAECLFMVQEMDYVGHKVNSDGIHPKLIRSNPFRMSHNHSTWIAPWASQLLRQSFVQHVKNPSPIVQYVLLQKSNRWRRERNDLWACPTVRYPSGAPQSKKKACRLDAVIYRRMEDSFYNTNL